ncbi:Stk1 family PASTA domain-containing Ser/Thr kinase [Oscillochloris sp. ZM17-4]|uniref:Stk1 family PASTA domain-containing Ser/Thr kinase n=1 Tax=Oscillochloris sp. ZM17-4 TaxID=2866714 RepID=UPI001C73773E|nr:Stk1 family PASTA domain-containing Ser/Thr kinase [Oscillochloris sp. ZM17-4]MBX0326337.1 Stk1 family PASTA domain-containing Ser/Thr kinase [Oscillochloris sp. ZM17-4]
MQQKVLDGRYELDRKIGEGGMARVYLGRDLRLNRRVAIKIPHRHASGDADFLDRFRHEAQAAAILAHPNIVDVYDVGQDGDIHYIVMEYVEGTDLKAVINREAPLTAARAVDIAGQIARGLSAAHKAGMVHRDIKPQNVIVTADGRARITDFGVAKSHLSTALTETGVSFGTVDYISPEQAQGRAATPQSDIYALGIVLYEMLTARLPFKGDSAVAVAMKHVTEEPPPPRQINPQIPAQLEALILRAMDKDPARRPRSAMEFADLIAGYTQIAQQETVVNPALAGVGGRPAQRGPTTQPPRQAGGSSGTGATGRVSIPMPRQTPARAPRQEGLGCGIFLVGMLILAGVLGIVMLFSTGALNGLFGSIGGDPRPTTSAPPPGGTAAPGEPSPTPDQRISVPTLVGLSDGAAQEQLLKLQLIPAPQGENNPTVSQGLVISQTVAPGELLAPGLTVTYTVSLGPLLVTVLDVTNTRVEIARSQLTALGIQVAVVEVPSVAIDAGFVIDQSPRSGLRIAQGETVTIRVSQGDVVRFPDVIGKTRAEAEAILAATPGMTLEFVDVQGRDRLIDFDTFAPGEVVSAQIQGGSGISNGELIPRGSRIILGVRAES